MGRPISANSIRKMPLLGLAIILCSLVCSSCGHSPPSQSENGPGGAGYQNPGQERPDSTQPGASQEIVSQDQILQAQASQARKVEVLFSARVRKMLPDDTVGLPHELFLLDLNNGTTVKVAHDTKYAPRVPIQNGDTVTIKGEYIWNRKGGVVHWTHHSDTPRHEGGYIDFAGNRYQ